VTHPLLETLDDDQDALIQLIGRPIVTDQPVDQLGWPVWDFVRRKLEHNRPGTNAEEVLASLPAVQRPADTMAGPYSLWWRTGNPHGALTPADRVGLTLPGLHHLSDHLDASVHVLPKPAATVLRLLDEAAQAEEELDSDDWWEVTRSSISLRERMSGMENPPVGILGYALQHEYTPLVIETSQFNFEFPLGNGLFTPFRRVVDVADYLSRLPLPAAADRMELPSSPLGLPATVDYLALVLASHDGWDRERKLVRLPDFLSASLVTQTPSNAAEFEQQLSALWTVIGGFDVPQADDSKYEERGWGKSRGSVNSLQIWLADNAPEYASSDQCASALRTIRKVGTLRQGAQHSSSETRSRAIQAQRWFGLPPVIIDYRAAWTAVVEALAAAFYSMCRGLT
jgi:hypothetical protein